MRFQPRIDTEFHGKIRRGMVFCLCVFFREIPCQSVARFLSAHQRFRGKLTHREWGRFKFAPNKSARLAQILEVGKAMRRSWPAKALLSALLSPFGATSIS